MSRHKANDRAGAAAIREMLDKLIDDNTVRYDGHCARCLRETEQPRLVMINSLPGFLCVECFDAL